jgi:Zn-dependent peptidase ImmA (M78 family)
MPTGRRGNATSQASMAAARLHARLHTDLSRPVDVFKIVQELGIWLNSRPLGNLFGFYLRQGDALGIFLNAAHPETLQRYTCAHELGHHLLGHDSNLDDASDIDGLGGGTPAQERAAQVFAGNFLMPLGLVNRVLRRLGLYDQSLSASDVYEVSRELDVSYTATVWRLRTLDRLDGPTATAYTRSGAAAAKYALRGGPPHGSARGDLWVVDKAGDDLIGKCRVGDEVLLRLVENRSTGYVWQIEEPTRSPLGVGEGLEWDGGENLTSLLAEGDELTGLAGDGVFRVAADQHREIEAIDVSAFGPPRRDEVLALADDPEHSWLREVLGRGGIREIAVIAENRGDGTLRVDLKPPWDNSAAALSTVSLNVRVVAQHELDGFARLQPLAHVSRLAS